MANDFSNENLLAYIITYRCAMANAARGIAQKMDYRAICREDKIKFTLAMIYLKMMSMYNESGCVDRDVMCGLSNYIQKYLSQTHYATQDCGCQ